MCVDYKFFIHKKHVFFLKDNVSVLFMFVLSQSNITSITESKIKAICMDKSLVSWFTIWKCQDNSGEPKFRKQFSQFEQFPLNYMTWHSPK
jgi:hypothetical protein